MKKVTLFIAIMIVFQQAWAQNLNNSPSSRDTVYWIQMAVDSGIVHAAVATPKGPGPFPAVIILHGTHGFAEEYVQLARRITGNGIIGIAACWFAGRRGEGTRSITPIACDDAPPLIDVPGMDRFRLSRKTVDSLIRKVTTLPNVQEGHIALFGHSRGAGATLDYVLTHPGKVQAAILNSGGYPPEFTKRAAEITAPILILHGTADSPADGGSTFTNVDMVRQFEAALRAANKPVTVKYYEGGKHNSIFSDPAQFEDSVQRLSSFLQNTL